MVDMSAVFRLKLGLAFKKLKSALLKRKGEAMAFDSVFRSGVFEGQVALVTGGGTGIGLATATLLGQLGAKVALCGRRPERLEEASAALRALNIDVFQAPCDIRDVAQVDSFIKAVLARFSRIDILVNNAGGQFPSAAKDISPKGFEAVVRNNLLGTWNVTHAVGNQAFIPQKRGKLVNIIAQIARGFPGMAHTGAARAGVENLTKSLAVEWAEYGVRSNAIAPGVIVTQGTEQYPPELLEMGRKATVVKRLGTAEEVAQLVAFLASPAADFITGQTVYLDGGASLYGTIWEVPEDVPGGTGPLTSR
jgi:citronellol/citronellal dehydrogenase